MTVRAEPRGGGWTCHVEVDDAGIRTTHTVTVGAEDIERYGASGADSVEDLVARSFAFLLEREAATSILRTFDLSVIRRYFPEYDQLFKR